VEELEKRLFQEQEKRIERERKLEAEIEVLSREQEILQKERANGMARLDEMTEEHSKVKISMPTHTQRHRHRHTHTHTLTCDWDGAVG
jgi:hypothetical protein